MAQLTYVQVANNATYAFGKSEGALNANSANNATYAYGKTEGNLNVNSAINANTANNASYLGGVAANGYPTLTGNNTFTGNTVFDGQTIIASPRYFGVWSTSPLAPFQVGQDSAGGGSPGANGTMARIISYYPHSQTPETVLRLVRKLRDNEYYSSAVDFKVKASQASGGAGDNWNPHTQLTIGLKNAGGVADDIGQVDILTLTADTQSAAVGNVTINTSSVLVGNSSVNTYLTSTGLYVNGSVGSNGQVLTSNGSTISWANAPGGANATFLSGNTVTTNASGLLISNSSANLYLTQGALFISGNTGTNGQVLTSNGTTIAWANAAGGSTVYHCKVYKSANQANLTSATVITFDSELNDSSGMHNVSTNTSQIVIPANGIYQVTGQLWLHQPADQGAYVMKAHIYINGAASGAEYWSSFRAPDAAVPHMVTWTGYLAAGSYVELYGSAAYASYPRGGNTYTTLEVTSLTLT